MICRFSTCFCIELELCWSRCKSPLLKDINNTSYTSGRICCHGDRDEEKKVGGNISAQCRREKTDRSRNGETWPASATAQGRTPYMTPRTIPVAGTGIQTQGHLAEKQQCYPHYVIYNSNMT
ncbi:hypothetical protein LDENG_00098670 [Lucifuga dentata]|nr:hypothetical protein LDENG_00098670 [Lucifuga dentata]